jgi:hypothetical protein
MAQPEDVAQPELQELEREPQPFTARPPEAGELLDRGPQLRRVAVQRGRQQRQRESRCSFMLGSASRMASARASEPPASAASMRTFSSGATPATSRSTSRITASERGANRTRWQRERMVTGTRASRDVVSTHTVEAPGSSTLFNSAENWSSRMPVAVAHDHDAARRGVRPVGELLEQLARLRDADAGAFSYWNTCSGSSRMVSYVVTMVSSRVFSSPESGNTNLRSGCWSAADSRQPRHSPHASS